MSDRNTSSEDHYGCPYPDCSFRGSDAEVDDHRVTSHRNEPQAGSNLHR